MKESELEQFADAIHSANCHCNHTDHCGWYYESWENPGWTRKDYLNRAKAVITILTEHNGGESNIDIGVLIAVIEAAGKYNGGKK